MLFHSYEFAAFFLVVLLLHAGLPQRGRVWMLLGASYLFYGSWDWRFLSLIFFSTGLDFWVGQRIHDSGDEAARRRYLALSVVGNLGVLGFFKYCDFFLESLGALLATFGLEPPPLLHIILPVGISFYTFQTLSYTIDIYRRHLEPTRRLDEFALFVAFFPQLVAGPIERARNLLPQIATPRPFRIENLYEGAYLIFWGLFLKVFAADNLAKVVDPIFAAEAPYAPVTVWIGLVAFAMQIYCDFAGYSNIARGTAKCLGYDLMINFNAPYLSTNPREFWRRWHISLSSWLLEYVFVSLGRPRPSRLHLFGKLFVTMVLGGLWHGAAWTFVLWGAYHGLLLAAHQLFERTRARFAKPTAALYRIPSHGVRVLGFFALFCLGLVLFRATSLEQSLAMTASMISGPWLATSDDLDLMRSIVFFAWIPMAMQIVQLRSGTPIRMLSAQPLVRLAFYLVCFYLLLLYGASGREDFIYFQF